jgi:uncharacterized protein YjbI with pentapeptide repeats
MANEEHLAILKQGTEAWNQWRKENPGIRPDFGGANLREGDLRGMHLRGAYFGETDLRRAHLNEAHLQGVRFVRANLGKAVLFRANLCGAFLFETDLTKADLHEADLRGAKVGWSVFGDVDLSVVKGLDSVSHLGPSTIGIDTIYRSGGNIPEVFLQGAGVPDTFITYIRSLVGQSIKFYSCFISHSARDKRFCDRLYTDLQANKVRAWYFHKDAIWGEPVWGEIDRSISVYDKVVVICSKHSLQSGPVLREIERALSREDREGKNILFPVRIDNYIFDQWDHPRKADVVSKVVGDFRGWNRSTTKYEVAFKKLLEALETGDSEG